ncbi:penicillin-binding protein [Mycobacteroides abscessus subsp. abscessus]|uniref:transglycosylase domain-containing protein n=1 Tax=Mycobacteroides abscessus TaxID=36809 RepID=UPI0019D28E92|nr:transglycosylase domain-containing protein [Mycobacteroides abscessus]MBN7521560.1 penicillin-binding protein [Mycobacteroides abscessus subsp. abscessus]
MVGEENSVAPNSGPDSPRTPSTDDRPTSILDPIEDLPLYRRDDDAVAAARAALERDEDGGRGHEPPPPPGTPGRPGGSSRPPQRRRKRKSNGWKIFRNVMIALVLLAIVIPLATFALAYSVVDIPKPGDIRTSQVSTILASDGTTELAKVVPPEGNRVDIKIDQVPQHVRAAVMAAEDRDFYGNPGFSFSGLLRAVKNNMFGGDTQGGSTITQQYVKNAMVGSQRAGLGGLTRKAKEIVISTKMSQSWSKDQVMEAYLNIIYFGRGAYGISAASKAYFDKPVEQLTVSEGALLAALIQRPSRLDPAVDLPESTNRWNWVLDGMVTIGALSAQDRAGQVYPATVPPEQAAAQNATTGPNGLIKRQVMAELTDLFNIDEQTLNTEGLQITTTIDTKAQQAAENAVNTTLQSENPDLRTAVVSIDPRTGAVKAYYGGSNAQGLDYAQQGLQTGSSFKVFALVAALQQGIGLGYQLDSSELTYQGITIKNSEDASCGTCSVAEALKRSLNTSFYRLMLKLKNGPEDVAAAAHNAGIAENFPGVSHTLSEDGQGGPPNNGVVLGQYQTRVLDMASAYATLAASGTYRKPHFIQKVVNADGQVLFDAGSSDNTGEKRISDDVANNAISAMKPIAAYSRGHALAGGRESASKTGTAQLGDTKDNKDAWMAGFTPSLSTAVWVGTDDGKPIKTSWGGPIYGSGLPSDIWKKTMDGALDGTAKETFPKPGPIGGYAGVPTYVPPPPVPNGPPAPAPTGGGEVTVIQPTIEIAPGITIPVGPPTTVPVGPAAPPAGDVPPPGP